MIESVSETVNLHWRGLIAKMEIYSESSQALGWSTENFVKLSVPNISTERREQVNVERISGLILERTRKFDEIWS